MNEQLDARCPPHTFERAARLVLASAAMRAAPLLVVACVLGGCNAAHLYAPPPPPPETIIVHVWGDPDEPVPGAEIGTGAGILGKTDASGAVRVSLAGADGTRFDVEVNCPASFGGTSRPLKVVLRRGTRTPEYEATCHRAMRTALVAVRALGAAGAPVLHLGHEVARVDAAGLALVTLDMNVGDTFSLAIDTNDPQFRFLRPQNPEMTFSVADADEVFSFEPQLHEEKPVVKRASPPKPHLPRHIE